MHTEYSTASSTCKAHDFHPNHEKYRSLRSLFLFHKYFSKFFRKQLTNGGTYGILILANIRRCGGMVDTGDLKSPGSNAVPVRVRSPAPSGTISYRGVEQLVARRAHNPEVAGSSPVSATILSDQNRYTHLKPLRNQGFQRFYALFFQSVFYRYTRAFQSVRQDLN